MGNCGAICKYKILGLKGDIILEKNSNNDTGKYLETEYIQKIIHIQTEIENEKPKKYSFGPNEMPIKIGRIKSEDEFENYINLAKMYRKLNHPNIKDQLNKKNPN